MLIIVTYISSFRVCSLLYCGHLLRKGRPSWPSFVMLNCEIVTVPFGILCQVWYLIVLIYDLCPHSKFHTVRIVLHILAVLVQ